MFVIVAFVGLIIPLREKIGSYDTSIGAVNIM